jgi:hypothetical protein
MLCSLFVIVESCRFLKIGPSTVILAVSACLLKLLEVTFLAGINVFENEVESLIQNLICAMVLDVENREDVGRRSYRELALIKHSTIAARPTNLWSAML